MGRRTLTASIAAVLVMLLLPSPGAALVAHQHAIVRYEYLPSGTVSKEATGSALGLWQTDYGYPVAQGDTITFTNLDTQPHTVTACRDCDPHPTPSGEFDSGWMALGDSWTLDTSELEPGQYRYFCLHHPFLMRGSFLVTER